MYFEVIKPHSTSVRILKHLYFNSINKHWVHEITKAVDSPESYVSMALIYLESIGLIYSLRGEKVGGKRKKNIFLSKNGEKVIKLILEIEEIIKIKSVTTS